MAHHLSDMIRLDLSGSIKHVSKVNDLRRLRTLSGLSLGRNYYSHEKRRAGIGYSRLVYD